MHKRNIGKVHPEFFNQSTLFKKFRVSLKDGGEAELISPFFRLKYSLKDGVLECKDEDVLLDFVDLIKKHYGINTTRDEFKKTIDFDAIETNYSVLNIGTCYFEDSYAGWDGSINAIWYDAKAPAKVLDVHFQYWSTKMLNGAWKLDEEDIKILGGGDIAVPNLVDSLACIKNAEHRDKVNALLLKLI